MRRDELGAKLAAAGALLALAVVAPAARADEVDDALRKLIDLDQRMHVLVLEFKDAPPPATDLADRRVIDAQVLYTLKNYDEAATILLDVVEKYPGSRAFGDAIYLLGESLYHLRDYLSSRRYLEMAIDKAPSHKMEQQALQRLVEIALRTGDYENVEQHLDRLGRIPPQYLEASVPYVRAKYYYFRERFDDALAGFNMVQPASPYYFQARYFAATTLIRKGDLAAASVAFDAILKLQPPDEPSKEIQDLARLALGRILYERSQFDRAVEEYLKISRQSKYFEDALYEQAWTFIKAKEFKRAFRALDLLVLQRPDSPQAPELKLLMGNLNLRVGNFFLAHDAFSKTREEFEPIHRQLQVALKRSETDPQFFQDLISRSFDKLDLGAFIPPAAAKWVRAEPDVARMLGLASDVVDLQKSLKDSTQLLTRLERATTGGGQVGLFSDLAAARGRSVEILNQLVDIRQRFTRQLRSALAPRLSPEETQTLDRAAAERASLERQLQNMPLTEDALKDRERLAKGRFLDLDKHVAELNVEIQGMEAQLVAIEQYYRASAPEQKIRPEDLQNPVRDMRVALDELHALQDKVVEEIAEASRDASTAGALAEAERQAAARLAELLKQEQEVHARARDRLSPAERAQIDRIVNVLARADVVQSQLGEFDKKVDERAEGRLGTLRERVATEKGQLEAAQQKLSGVLTESQALGGGLAQAMFTRVADRFYDLVVRSDVGIIDVAWGLKDQKTQTVSRLVNQQKMELKALEEDFHRVLEDDK